jgi:hypothetical protein
MNTLTVQNIHSVWPIMQAKSCRVPSIPDMVDRRSEGKRAATKVMIRYIPYSQEELDAVVDALIDATRPAPLPVVVEPEPMPVVVTSHMRTETTRSHMRSDALFILSLFVAVVVGLWNLATFLVSSFAVACTHVAPAFEAIAQCAITALSIVADALSIVADATLKLTSKAIAHATYAIAKAMA